MSPVPACLLRPSFYFVIGSCGPNSVGVYQAHTLGPQRAKEYPANSVSAGGIQVPRPDLRIVRMEHHNWIVPIDLISELISTGRSWLLDDKLLEAPNPSSSPILSITTTLSCSTYSKPERWKTMTSQISRYIMECPRTR